MCFSFAVPPSPTNGVDQKTNDKTKVEIIKPIEEVDNNNNEETMLVRLVITIEIFYLIWISRSFKKGAIDNTISYFDPCNWRLEVFNL